MVQIELVARWETSGNEEGQKKAKQMLDNEMPRKVDIFLVTHCAYKIFVAVG